MVAVIRPRHHRVVGDRINPFLFLRNDLSIGEREADLVLITRCLTLASDPVRSLTRARPAGQPARVIEVQMADHSQIDITRVDTRVLHGVLDRASVEAEDLGHLWIELVARARLDQDRSSAASEQQCVV